ncbi:MAG: type II secretion system minor pseudopilin GspI [Burkholderiaceae bacterium]
MTATRTPSGLPSQRRGFTLIEVLVALVIVSLVLAASMRAGGTMIVTQDALRRATLAGWSAENRLAEVRLARTFPAVGVSESQCPQIDVAMVCVIEVRTTPNPAMRRVDVRVYEAVDRNRQLAHRLSFQSSLP